MSELSVYSDQNNQRGQSGGASAGAVRLKMGAAYVPLISNRDPCVGVEGPRGTAKTRSICSLLLTRALEYPNSRILLCRRYRSDLTQTVIQTLERQVFPAFGMEVPGSQNPHGRTSYDLPNGSSLVPRGVDEGQKLLSSEWTFAYVAQAEELEELTATQLRGAMRHMRTPEHPELPDFTQIIYDFNPVHPRHWGNQIMEKCEDVLRIGASTPRGYALLQEYNRRPAENPLRRWKRLVTRHQDNPGYFDQRLWDWTALGRHYVKTTLEGLTGHLRSRWLDGLWVAADGAVYAGSFVESRNVIPRFKVPASWPCYVYIDFGMDHPTAAGWFVISPSGKRILVGEIHASGLDGPAHLACLIKQKNADLGVVPAGRYFIDPRHGFESTFQSKATIADQLAAEGISCQGYARFQGKGVQASVEMVAKAFRDGELLFVEDCVGFIGDHQAWAYKRTPTGDLPDGDDAYENKNNDACDATRGFIAANHPVEKPNALRALDPEEQQREFQEQLRRMRHEVEGEEDRGGGGDARYGRD